MSRPAPRLVLALALDPARPAMETQTLESALAAGEVACLLVRAEGRDDAILPLVEPLRAAAHRRDVAFVLMDRIDLAARTRCDGVHMSAPEAVAAARARLGGEAIVGAGCGASRHDAMTAGEAGADYVAFGALTPDPEAADPELLSWWQAVMTPPCLALGAATPEDAARMALAGADFVAVERAIWTHAEGPAAAARAFADALGHAEAAIARDPPS